MAYTLEEEERNMLSKQALISQRTLPPTKKTHALRSALALLIQM
jgi:hypothetical protein